MWTPSSDSSGALLDPTATPPTAFEDMSDKFRMFDILDVDMGGSLKTMFDFTDRGTPR